MNTAQSAAVVAPLPGWHALPFAGLLLILPFPGTVALRLLCLAAAFLIALLWWRRLAPPPIPGKTALLAWAIVALASLGYAADPAYSLVEIKNELGYTMMAFLAFFAVTRDDLQLRLWVCASIAAVVIVSAWALVVRAQLGYWDDGRGHGGVGSFASLVVAVVPVMAIGWVLFVRHWQRTLLVLAAALVMIAAYHSHQRILWVALGVELVLALVLLRLVGRLQPSRAIAGAAVAAVIVVAGALLLSVHENRLSAGDRIEAAIDKDTRLAHWERIVDRIAEHPLTGGGFGRESMKKAYPDLVSDKPPLSMLWHPHNVFLTYGVAMGVPGIIALLAVFLALAAAYWRRRGTDDPVQRVAAVAGLALLAGVVTRNLTNDFFLRDGALMFWALNGALLGYLARRAAPEAAAGKN